MVTRFGQNNVLRLLLINNVPDEWRAVELFSILLLKSVFHFFSLDADKDVK